jgi:hypothetical protein
MFPESYHRGKLNHGNPVLENYQNLVMERFISSLSTFPKGELVESAKICVKKIASLIH